MNKGKKWETLSEFKISHKETTFEELINTLLKNRGLKTKEAINDFLHPTLETVTPNNSKINLKQLQKAIKRIQKAIENKEQIVVFGDYDVDGITATAIMWETLHSLGALAVPYIPHRIDEGYGLSEKGIANVKAQVSNAKVIITVDNGIVANEAVDFAKKEGIDVIITDHHTLPKQLPKALAIVHTTQLCGAGVAYLLAQKISSQKKVSQLLVSQSDKQKTDKQGSDNRKQRTENRNDDHLALVALATVADLVPLTGANRVLLIHGLEMLRTTNRPGIRALCEEAEVKQEEIDVYTIGHILAPRLNAMGRLESAMDSLRLLCTTDGMRAKALAEKLGITNRERQILTQTLAQHAVTGFTNKLTSGEDLKKILFIANDAYEEGVIGLVAGKLVEQFYRPAIVLSIGEKQSKASARSVVGFNIIEFIRSASHLLINAGGHPMAAGFTVETEKITLLQEYLEQLAEEQLDGDMLTRVLKIDCELPLDLISPKLYSLIQTLGPFGMGNPEPVFSSKVLVKEVKTVGQEGKHLKLKVSNGTKIFSTIAFGMGEMSREIKPGDSIDIAYIISENVWNGNVELQLKIRDIKI